MSDVRVGMHLLFVEGVRSVAAHVNLLMSTVLFSRVILSRGSAQEAEYQT